MVERHVASHWLVGNDFIVIELEVKTNEEWLDNNHLIVLSIDNVAGIYFDAEQGAILTFKHPMVLDRGMGVKSSYIILPGISEDDIEGLLT